MYSIDIIVQSYLSSVRTLPITEYMYIITRLFDFAIPFLLMIFVVAGIVYYTHGKKEVFLFLSTLACTAVVVYFLKMFFNVNRPLEGLIGAYGQSFPSYHATMATVFFGLIMHIFDQYFNRFWRIIFNIFCTGAFIIISFSRLYLGVHWFSDVLAGIILGIILLGLFVQIHKNMVRL